MNKTKVEIYLEVLRDVYQNFEGTEEFLNRECRKYAIEKISVEEVIHFFIYKGLCFKCYSMLLTYLK